MQLIPCPYCGSRVETEFVYGRVAEAAAPATAADESTELQRIFVRTNAKGLQRELWQHVSGCRSWIAVTRHTVTHEIIGSEAFRKEPA